MAIMLFELSCLKKWNNKTRTHQTVPTTLHHQTCILDKKTLQKVIKAN